jgi:hypothetical protein
LDISGSDVEGLIWGVNVMILINIFAPKLPILPQNTAIYVAMYVRT